MAYVPAWLRLSDAIECVVAATGAPVQAVHTDICRAIGDGAVKLRAKLKEHQTRHFRASNTVLDQASFDGLTDIKPEDLDWEQSRPLKPWFVKRDKFNPAGYWRLEWIELSSADLRTALCGPEHSRASSEKASRHAGSVHKMRPSFERAQRALEALYPDGVPPQAELPNALLCRRVGEWLKQHGLVDVSNSTILRAAGRRK